ncbi:MAG: hypothetical protein IKY06_02390 [Clostridia bacterium]|nr:hypothetical protein [Clostridia bacterium]
MSNRLRTLLALILVLALLPGALAGGFLSGLLGKGGSAKLSFVSVKDKAFSADNSRVIAASGDGARVLIMNPYELYIWDTKTNRRVPVWFGGEQDIEQLNFMVQTSYVLRSNAKKDQQDALRAKYDEVTGSYFKREGITRFTTLDEVSQCFPMLIQIGARTRELGPRWALVDANNLGARLLIDLDTGEACFIEGRLTALCGGRLLSSEDGSVTDLATGETYFPEYEQVNQEYFGALKTLKLLDDDSLLALLPGSDIGEDKTRTMLMAVVSPSGTRAFSLGTFDFMREPSQLLVTGNGRYAAAYYPQAYYAAQAVIADLDTGEVKTPGFEQTMLVASAPNGFICYDINKAVLVMLDPETLETTKLSVSGKGFGGTVTYTMISSVADNGAGLYFSQSEILHGYFELEE